MFAFIRTSDFDEAFVDAFCEEIDRCALTGIPSTVVLHTWFGRAE